MFDVKDDTDHPFILNHLINSIDGLKISIENNSKEIRDIMKNFDSRIAVLEKHKETQDVLNDFKRPFYSQWYNIAKFTGSICILLFSAGVYITSSRIISSELSYQNASKQIEINKDYVEKNK